MASFYILLAILLWSSLGIVVRLSDVAIHILIFYSFVVALILQGVILTKKTYRKNIPGFKKIKYIMMFGIVSLLNMLSYFYAFKNTTIANAVLTHYTAPAIVAFLAPVFLKEKITEKVIIAIIIASVGLWIMLNGFTFQEDHTRGILSGLFSGLTYAVIVILARVYAQNYNPLVLTFFSNIAIVILLVPFVREIPLHALWSFLLMGIVHSTIAPILYFRGLQSITAQRAAVLGYFEPVGAILLAVLIFGESPSGMAVIGGILILTSGYIAITKRI